MNNIIVPFSLAILINTFAYADPEALVPQTGQTTCYNSSGNAISCANTGQDGALQAGAAWPTPRFVYGEKQNGDDCSNGQVVIIDKLTKLMWLGNANDYNGGDKQTWNDAMDASKTPNLGEGGSKHFNYCGYNDWRLPNIVELKSLLNYAVEGQANWLTNPNGDGTVTFANIDKDDPYFTSSIYATDTVKAWVINIRDVQSTFLYGKYHRTNPYYILPVRGPVSD